MILGITGPTGSGKSTVTSYISSLFEKSLIVDIDRVGHEVLTLSFVIEKLSDLFGKDILDEKGNISRSALAKIVFRNNDNLEKLNKTVHPEIFKKTERIIKEKKNFYDIIILDAAVLKKIGIDTLCDRNLIITANEDIRIKRLTDFRNINYEKAKAMIESQRNICFGNFYTIDNSSGIDCIKEDIKNFLNI